jgi:diguanylate cyclase (GGDEF)-like protein/PAS domain S-box-containing protein
VGVRSKETEQVVHPPAIPRSCYPRAFGAPGYPVAVLGSDFRFVDANETFQREVALSLDELRGQGLAAVWDFDPTDHADELARDIEASGAFEVDVHPTRDRPNAPAATLHLMPIVDPGGLRLGYCIAIVSERSKREKLEISLASEGFQLSFDQISVGMMITGIDGYAIKWNPAMARILDRSFEQIAETDVLSMIHPDHRTVAIEQGVKLITKELGGYIQESRLLRGDGTEVWVQETASMVWDPDGNPLHYVTQFVDISDRKRIEEERNRAIEALVESQAKIRFLFDGTPTPIVEIDASLTICAANAALTQLLGRDPIGLSIVEVVHPDDMVRLAAEGATIEPDTDWIIDIRVSSRDAGERQVRSHGRIHHDEHGAFRSATATWHDITDARKREERLQVEATTDPLTGLPHRASLLARLDELVATATSPTSVAVLFVDLDRFKPVNDNFGHEAGDHLLCQVARRLRTCVRAEDMVARLGGDEFVVTVDLSTSGADPTAIGERIVERLARPFASPYGVLSIGASVGLAFGGIGSEPRDIIHRADLAVYQAKASGRSRLAFATG